MSLVRTRDAQVFICRPSTLDYPARLLSRTSPYETIYLPTYVLMLLVKTNLYLWLTAGVVQIKLGDRS